jgi:putative flippase GtrA
VRIHIVVPCYNEAARLPSSAFDDFASHEDVGFVLVNDGSRDETLGVLQKLASRWPGRIEVVDQQPNQGKAEAVRVGMLRAMDGRGAYAGYFDADLATPLDAIPEFSDVLDRNPRIDVVLGARVALLGRKVERNAARHYLGRVFATAASLVLGLPVYDTQCGAKLLRATPSLRELFARPFGSRWIFDVELIARYLTAPGASEGLYELPLQSWIDVAGSRVKAQDFMRATGEMAAIYRSYRLRSNLNSLLALVSAPFVRYIGAGGVGTIFHYATLALLVELAHVSPTAGTIVGALVGACVNYFLNYHLTFASKDSHRRTLPRFFAVAAFAALLNGLGMWLAVQRLHIYYLAAQVACTGAVLVVGFVLNKIWTFGPRSAALLIEEGPPSTVRTVAVVPVDGEGPQ